MQEFTFIPLHVSSPLFQPVKIFLNLSVAVLSITNPSGFVSTANLISTSPVLLHPSCRKKSGGRVKGWALGCCWRCSRADTEATGRPHPGLIRGLRGFEECVPPISTPLPLSEAPPCPSCPRPFRAGIQLSMACPW